MPDWHPPEMLATPVGTARAQPQSLQPRLLVELLELLVPAAVSLPLDLQLLEFAGQPFVPTYLQLPELAARDREQMQLIVYLSAKLELSEFAFERISSEPLRVPARFEHLNREMTVEHNLS